LPSFVLVRLKLRYINTDAQMMILLDAVLRSIEIVVARSGRISMLIAAKILGLTRVTKWGAKWGAQSITGNGLTSGKQSAGLLI
jgi:hypothetical protein